MPRFWVILISAIRQSRLDRDRSGLPTRSDFFWLGMMLHHALSGIEPSSLGTGTPLHIPSSATYYNQASTENWHDLLGFEPRSCGFGDRCFTVKLRPHILCDSRLDYHATTYQRVSISATENPSASLYYGSFQRAFFILCGEFRHQPHHPGATRPLVTKGRNRTFDLRSGYGFSSNLCLCALGIGHLLLHRSSTELPLHIWGGEQVMSLHPCVPLKRYRQRSVLHQGHRMNVQKNFNSFGKQYSFYTTFENELKFSGRKTSTHFCGVPNRTEH